MSQSLHPDLDPKKVLNLPLRRWNLWLFRLLLRWMVPSGRRPEGIACVTQSLDGVSLRIHRPTADRGTGALLWIHGGGMVMGNPAQDDLKCAAFANDLNCTVLAVSYRLAPRNPYPAAIDDVFAAWQAIVNHADSLGIDPKKIAIGGASAGGGLAACLCQRIADAGGVQPVAQLLIYPMADDRTTNRTDIDPTAHAVWNQRCNVLGWGSYLGEHMRGGETLGPYAAASRREDLTGLPPAWLGVGTLDLFCDEDVAYARRLEAAGVDTTLTVVDGAYHAFEGLDPTAEVSQHFVMAMNDFLRPHIAT